MKKNALSRFKSKLKFIPLLIVSLLIFLATLFLRTTINAKNNLNQAIFQNQDYVEFENFVKKNGVNIAYSILKEKYPDNDAVAHNFAHIIGFEALYQKGLDGLEICDSAYNYGCYHGFIEVYLKENGKESVKNIENYCDSLGNVHAPSCLHGIGHGEMIIAEYDLNEALENCNLLRESARTFCWDGVFMERISGSMLGGGERIKVSEATLMEPCVSIDKIYREQCFRNQVSVWYPFFNNDIGRIARECSYIETQYMKTCFESIGLTNVISSQANWQAIIDNCLKLNNDALDFCMIGSLKEYMFEGKDPQIASSFCNFVSSKYRGECERVFSDHLQQFNARFQKTVS